MLNNWGFSSYAASGCTGGCFGTLAALAAARERRRRQERAQRASAMAAAAEARGDDRYGPGPGGEPLDTKDPQQVPFSAALVTGACGLVGQHLVAMLAARGAKRIVCMDIMEVPSPDFASKRAHCSETFGCDIEYVQYNIAAPRTDIDPFVDVEVVFHVAAIVGVFHRFEAYDPVNHIGTKHVLERFLRSGRRARGAPIVFVDCGSPATRYPNSGEMPGVLEDDMAFNDNVHEYATSKARGERAVLIANGKVSACGCPLATCTVAPETVYAPEDRVILASLLVSAQQGLLRVLGSGENNVSFTHADNISHGLILAASKLWHEGATSAAAGEFFVVNDGDAQNFWDAVDDAVQTCGLPSVRAKCAVPELVLWPGVFAGVLYTKLTGHIIKLTPFSFRMVLRNRVLAVAKARHVLGYRPVVAFEDGWREAALAIGRRQGILPARAPKSCASQPHCGMNAA